MSYTVYGEVKAETDDAILIADECSGEEVWIPLSQVDKITRRGKSPQMAEMDIPDWLATKKGLA